MSNNLGITATNRDCFELNREQIHITLSISDGELASAGFELGTNTPKVHCKALDDNSGVLEMAKTPNQNYD
jgi:hypothetical protein